MKRKTFYHVCFLKYRSEKGINGINVKKNHIFQRYKIEDNFCIHHARDEYDHDVFAQLIDVFDTHQKAHDFKMSLKSMSPQEIINYREYKLKSLKTLNKD